MAAAREALILGIPLTPYPHRATLAFKAIMTLPPQRGAASARAFGGVSPTHADEADQARTCKPSILTLS